MPHCNLPIVELRARWLPTKQKLDRTGASHPLATRIHRALSWLDLAEKESVSGSIDAQLIFRWFGLNAMYGRWSPDTGEPEPAISPYDSLCDR